MQHICRRKSVHLAASMEAESESKKQITLTYQFNNGLYREKEFPPEMTMNKALSLVLKDIDEKG